MIFVLATAGALSAQEWPTYGNDPGGSRFSPLSQIHGRNVQNLRVAWTYRAGMVNGKLAGKAAFEVTPIYVRGTLYLSTPDNRVIALDGFSGREKWTYDPKVSVDLSYSEVASRGVAYSNGRLYMGTIDARLIALDATTGKPATEFGTQGEVDLTAGVGLKDRGDYQVTSPPAIANGLVIVGSSIGDNGRFDRERGVVRAYDARTGKLAWSWDPLPVALKSGAANAWAPMAVDEKRGLVFVATGSASPDFFGGLRPGDNRWANSVVALRARTGEVAWGFQVVHHDLWDYDVAAQPMLVDVNGKADVLVATKMGLVHLLDRDNGKPIWPVVERPVPQSDIPGESASATQPFPASDSLSNLTLTEADLWSADPDAKARCMEQFRGLRYEGIFTPPSTRGTLLYPGNVGGVNWGAGAHDPKRQLAFYFVNRLPTMVRLIPRAEFAAAVRSGRENRLDGEFGSQSGTPFGMFRQIMFCFRKPWGVMAAMDLRTGKKIWETPVGDGAPGLGGPLATAGGLVFAAASIADNHLRAWDSATGKLLWQHELPAGGQATPMTYQAGGKQFIVIGAGGHGKAKTKPGDYIVAYALP